MNDNHRATDPEQTSSTPEDFSDPHPLSTGLGAAAGGVAGAALGSSVGGQTGKVLGAVTGAIAGGVAGHTLAQTPNPIEQVNQALGLGLGADHKGIKLPQHYTWEELKALSKPQFSESSYAS